MQYIDFIDNALKDGTKGIHIECSGSIFNTLVNHFKQKDNQELIAVHFEKDSLYEAMHVKEYLGLFYNLFDSKADFNDIITRTGLQSVLKKKNSKLSESEKMRVCLARELLKCSHIHLFEQPLNNLDSEDSKLIISIIEELMESGAFVLTTSPSFREVCLMPGQTFYFKSDELIPIVESIDSDWISTTSSPNLDKLLVKVNGRILMIPISDILFAESIDSITNLYVKNSYVPTSFTLDELEQKISKLGFFRTHRSYLVNTQKIREVEQWTKNSYVINLEGLDSIKIPLSKRRYRDFQENL